MSETIPLRVGVVGLVHTHVHWILDRENLGDIKVVGIVEPNRELAKRYSEQHGYSMDIVYNTLEQMVEATQPEAVTAFNTIFGHLEVVEYCAPRGIHVMVEKPLAVSLAHAEKMIALAERYGIYLLTNYETSWYATTREAHRITHEESGIGEIRKILFHTGHPGPIEIGCNTEFLDWLTDPVLNGGGALTDFGCYGANLTTWLMKGVNPITVHCVTQQIKPELYPNVEDEATIILTYSKAQVIIQASWNWAHNRKDMQIHGTKGFIICHDAEKIEILHQDEEEIKTQTAPKLPAGLHDPLAFLQKVIRGNHSIEKFDLSSLENNYQVMKILEIAKYSAQTRKTVRWDDYYK
ncbi:MAG: Gfo/Idh/MocA family oxidoreductase [Saprospiraceae bacterium]|nr:Gfo/Idh/MocA family oxidoreductase [Saprospiraceae bacterium]